MRDKRPRLDIESQESWLEWVDKIPALNFKEEWDVKIIPPFGGAMVRFWIDFKDEHVSVYLDCFDCLGYFDGPYWEVYPYEGDVARFGMNDTDNLIVCIGDVLAGGCA